MFKVGDKVRIKPEWCDHPEGAQKEYTVVNVNDVTKRCYIEAEVPGFSFPLQSLVAFEMIEKIEEKKTVKYITTLKGMEITEEALKTIYDMFVAPADERDYNAWKNDRIENGVIRRIEENA